MTIGGENGRNGRSPARPTRTRRTRSRPCTKRGERSGSPAQKEIDASIAAKAEVESLYDKPFADSSRVRVAGPFTVETLSPRRVLAVTDEDKLSDTLDAVEGRMPAPERCADEATSPR
jgi:hypothetical protein